MDKQEDTENGQANLKDERNGNEIVMDIHKTVIALANEFRASMDAFFEKENKDLTRNEKFLVISRAINITAKSWYENYFKQLDPEQALGKVLQEREEILYQFKRYTEASSESVKAEIKSKFFK